MQARSGRIIDSMSLPLAMAGATSQDRIPMGRAAAAQIMKMPFLLYCVTVTARSAGAPPTCRSMVVVIGWLLAWWSVGPAGEACDVAGLGERSGGGLRHAVTMSRTDPHAIGLEAMSAAATYTRGCTRKSAHRPRRAEARVGTVSSDGRTHHRAAAAGANPANAAVARRCSARHALRGHRACSRPASPIRATRSATRLAIALILVATVPYYLRRAAPLPVLIVTLTATAALFIDGYDAGALPFLVAVGIYTVGAYRPLREVVAAMVFVIAALFVMLVADSPRFAVPEFATSVPIYVATMLVGWTMQSRRLREDAFEREQGEAALRAAADERLRIAQELHDVIGHSLGVIAVQAGVGMHLIDSDPAEAKNALEHISRTSRSSLAEIRRLLGLVRSGEGADTYAPTPGLSDLARLADEVTDAGVAVDLTVSTRRPRPPARRGAGRLPHRAGGAHQRPQARPGQAGDRAARRRPRGAAGRGDRRRHRRRRRAAAARRAATVSSACASGWRSTAARSTSVPATTVAIG